MVRIASENWTWPGLVNPRATEPVVPLFERHAELRRSRPKRAWFLSRLYRTWRFLCRVFSTVRDEATRSPTKTAVDALTGIPIAAFAIPPFREWVTDRWESSWFVFSALIGARFIFGLWRRGKMQEIVRENLGLCALKIQVILDSTASHMRARTKGETVSRITYSRVYA